ADKAKEIYKELSKYFMCTYDETGNIGKRYRREDVIGTPWCITIDDETLNNNTVTLRDRDTMKQITLNLDEVKDYVLDKIIF
ncbi:MAG: glycine--tRNA ligase, partial [Bacilli bacterium]|nr:glycine--tRNA ligase [Bacilli bacterium]